MENNFETPHGTASYFIDPNNKTCVVKYMVNTFFDPALIKLENMKPELIGWKYTDKKPTIDERFIQDVGTRLLFSFPIEEA
jgi:hypothetical protein